MKADRAKDQVEEAVSEQSYQDYYDDDDDGDHDDDDDDDESDSEHETVISDSESSLSAMIDASSRDHEHLGMVQTWLFTATDNGFICCMEVLLKQHAQLVAALGQESREHYIRPTLLSVAAENGNIHAVNLLLTSDPTKVPVWCAETALSLAYQVRHLPCIETLINYGASPLKFVWTGALPHVYEDWLTPISYAVEANDMEMVTLLVQYLHVDDEPFKDPQTPLVRAIRRHNIPMITYLLALGAKLSHPTKRDFLPICIAASTGFEDSVDLLIDWGADINDCDKHGRSALDHALCGQHDHLVEKLLEYNPTISQATFRAIAARCSATDLSRLLTRQKDHIRPHLLTYGLCESIIAKDENQVKVFLEYNPDLWHTKTSRHALNVAVEHGTWSIVRRIINYGQATNQFQPHHGPEALHIAIKNRNPAIAELLLSRGANPNVAVSPNTTALHEAIGTGRADLVLVLLRRGADARARTASGRSIMRAAVEMGSQVIYDMVRAYGAQPSDMAHDMGDDGLIFPLQDYDFDTWPTG